MFWDQDINSKTKSRRTSKLSEDDFIHHKKSLPSAKISVYDSYYQSNISKFEREKLDHIG